LVELNGPSDGANEIGAAHCLSDDNGMPSFDRIRYRASVFLYAFDLIELNGDDFRRDLRCFSSRTRLYS
jgi:hypothetical protein